MKMTAKQHAHSLEMKRQAAEQMQPFIDNGTIIRKGSSKATIGGDVGSGSNFKRSFSR
jgi:hypothetical protein